MTDTAGKLRDVVFRPGGATEISQRWSEAQPPGQVEEVCSRPGRDAGPEFSTGPIPVRRPFRTRSPVVTFPAPPAQKEFASSIRSIDTTWKVSRKAPRKRPTNFSLSDTVAAIPSNSPGRVLKKL